MTIILRSQAVSLHANDCGLQINGQVQVEIGRIEESVKKYFSKQCSVSVKQKRTWFEDCCLN